MNIGNIFSRNDIFIQGQSTFADEVTTLLRNVRIRLCSEKAIVSCTAKKTSKIAECCQIKLPPLLYASIPTSQENCSTKNWDCHSVKTLYIAFNRQTHSSLVFEVAPLNQETYVPNGDSRRTTRSGGVSQVGDSNVGSVAVICFIQTLCCVFYCLAADPNTFYIIKQRQGSDFKVEGSLVCYKYCKVGHSNPVGALLYSVFCFTRPPYLIARVLWNSLHFKRSSRWPSNYIRVSYLLK
jgi:hypothetical protein